MPKKEPYETPEDQIPARVKEATRRSGKPLEVVCARSFLQAPRIHPAHGEQREDWKVYLNSYYHDAISDKMRELDVLARRQRYVKVGDSAGFNCVLEAFLSCKGFLSDEHLVAFTMRRIVDVKPEDPPVVRVFQASVPYPRKHIAQDAVEVLMTAMCGWRPGEAYAIRRTVGFDVVKDSHEDGAEWQSKGDRTFFEGLDSAMHASFFWSSITLPPFHSMNEGLLRVQIPVMVFLRPWYEISIDDGTRGDPVKSDLSFTANLYPLKGVNTPPASLFTLLVSRDRLPDLQKGLVDLYGRMWDWGMEAYKGPG